MQRIASTPSTQDLAAARLQAGERTPFAVLAAEQTAGRGRLGRRFVSPPGGSLALSFAHRTGLPFDRRGWVPLVTGLAAVAALRAELGGSEGDGGDGGDERDGARRLGLKWPNDIQTSDGSKLGGILVEGRGTDGLVIGIGVNLAGPIQDRDGSMVDHAAWLLGPGGLLGRERSTSESAAERVEVLRERIAAHLASGLAAELEALEQADGDGGATGAHKRYTMTCLTIGRSVRVDPLGSGGAGAQPATALHGIAHEIDADGRLVVSPACGERVAVDVGDVRHVRPNDGDR